MAFNSNNIYIASLLGSKQAKSIPNFELVQNELRKRVLPPIPFLNFNTKTPEIEVSENRASGNLWSRNEPVLERQFFPLQFRRKKVLRPGEQEEPFYTFPFEPLVTISGKNNIVKRNIAKAPNFIGTVKERFSQDDYEVTITGTLFGSKEVGTSEECYPREDFERLRDYCISENGIEVLCEPLQLLGINTLIVEDFSFPFTKGENVQAYELKCYSDFTADFLLEIEE